jgi:hypothetical protein
VHAGQQAGAGRGRLDQVVAAQQQSGLGQGRDGQAVPGRHHLVVPARPRPPLAGFGQRGADRGEPLRLPRVRAALQHRPALLEGAGLADPEHLGGVGPVLRAERGGQLGRAPDVELALLALAVRVE